MRGRWQLLVTMFGLALPGCASDSADLDVDAGSVLPRGPGASVVDAGALADAGAGVRREDAAAPLPGAQLDSGVGRPPDAGVAAPSDAAGADTGAQDANVGAAVDADAQDSATAGSSCPASTTLKPGNSGGSLQVNGVKRDYLLHVPPGYDGKSAVPLVLDFHPLLMDAAYQRSNSGYAALADKEGFIVAYPDGVDPAWNVGPCCTKDRNVDDVGFAKALVAKLKGEACVDAKRVYAVGFSNGGGMAHHVACNAADVFAAVAPAAFDLLVDSEQPCRPARPISVLSFRSTNDGTVPYAGGASTPPTLLLGYSLAQIHFLGAQGTFARWAELNKCTDTPSDTGSGCKTYKQCAAGVEVTLCTSSSAGHATGPAAQGWATLKRFAMP